MPGYPTRLAPSGTVPDGSTALWKDKKRYLWLIGLVVPSLAFIGMGGFALTGWGVWLWLGPIVILLIVPAIDLIAGLDRSNPPDDVIEALKAGEKKKVLTGIFQVAGHRADGSVITDDSEYESRFGPTGVWRNA